MGSSLYDYGLNSSASELENLFALMGTSVTQSTISAILNIVSYVLLAIGLYTIAKRRGINHPWLAWIPVANVWLLGCVSDQYQYVVRHQEKNKRKAMLVLEFLMLAGGAVIIALLIQMLPEMIQLATLSSEADFNVLVNNGAFSQLLQNVGWISVIALVIMGLGIAQMVLMYMAYYDLFASCEPNNKVLYLVIGIFAGIMMSVFVFVCRKKDWGMPPRRDQMGYQPPQPNMWTPPQQNTWQPPHQPPVEPWDQNWEN